MGIKQYIESIWGIKADRLFDEASNTRGPGGGCSSHDSPAIQQLALLPLP